MSRSTAGPNESDAYRRRFATSDLLAQVGNLHTSLLAGRTDAHVDRTVVEALLSCRNANGDADQVGVGELLARPQVAVVEEDILPGGL
jgi:hypothetical protein